MVRREPSNGTDREILPYRFVALALANEETDPPSSSLSPSDVPCSDPARIQRSCANWRLDTQRRARLSCSIHCSTSISTQRLAFPTFTGRGKEPSFMS